MAESLNPTRTTEIDAIEEREWLDSLDYVIAEGGPERVQELLRALQRRAAESGIELPYTANTPYLNTIPREAQPNFPGTREIERRIKSIIRWNAMAMVVRANRVKSGIGGHISTYASAASLYEVAFNHFFHGPDHPDGGDQVYFQGHASPGIYARAFIEGRLSIEQIENFRRELKPGGGLPSYPHPRSLRDFWQFPTVSMGLGPISAIYQARFNRYLEDRGLCEKTGRVWAFLGDGETDEPETLGAISLAARERLDNLIFVINCNLQRLDGPVRGNGKIIQELEANFRGTGWNVIKVIWGEEWDSLLDADREGVLAKRMEEAVDGDYQNYSVKGGGYIREHFFGTDPRLAKMVEHFTDEEIAKLGRGGHDPEKVYAAYRAAVENTGSPTVILAKTIKGYGLGEAGEGKNITHQQKKLNEDELREFRARFGIPISDDEVGEAPFYRPPDDSPEMRYLHERRKQLGGYLPTRLDTGVSLKAPSDLVDEFRPGTEDREVSTTQVTVRLLSKLLKDKEVGKYIVPIVPDEARTFGMESLFRQVGIYSHVGQRYEPVDRETLLYYKEATDGQILEEGITEAGSIASFIAAGTAYSTHGVPTIPFFIYYSMFGFQRVGDQIWAAGDMRARGFLLGGTAGRTTLAGEGLQHQDGHSLLLAYTHPHVLAYDPAFAYETAVLVQEGMRRMFTEREDICYYLTIENEQYAQPAMPDGVEQGILRGAYCFRKSNPRKKKGVVKLLGSGAILNETLKAQQMLADDYGVDTETWSITSYQQLFREGLEVARWNRMHPEEKPRQAYVSDCFGDHEGTVVAASDYLKALPYSLRSWIGGNFVGLGTDGFGLSEGRESLRDYFEVDARHITWATLEALASKGEFDKGKLKSAKKKLDIDADKPRPVID